MIDKRVKNFISKKFNLLKNKKVAYFICYGFNEKCKEYYEQNFPKDLFHNVIIYEK